MQDLDVRNQECWAAAPSVAHVPRTARRCLIACAAVVAALMLCSCVRKITVAPIADRTSNAIASLAPRTTARLPVITYHRITTEVTSQMAVSPTLFTRHMQYLKDHGYTPITLDDWYMAVAYGFKLPEKPVAITFDDAWADQYTHALPILKRFGFRATFYAYTTIIGSKAAIPWDRLRRMAEQGHCIGCHTATHGDLARRVKGETDAAYEERLDREIADARAVIEAHLGCQILHFCYPYGYYNTNVVARLRRAQYRTAVTVNPMVNSEQTPLLQLGRVVIGSWVTPEVLGRLISQQPFAIAGTLPGDGVVLTHETTQIAAVLPLDTPVLPGSLKMKWNWKWAPSAWNPSTRTVASVFTAPLKPGIYTAQVHGWDAGSNHYVYAWEFQQGDIRELDTPDLEMMPEAEPEPDLVLLTPPSVVSHK